mmetsp:Transcript_20054/g.50597  ORF Transcript_20054/g.50597 Transcript_20054/m.50597 type:complete len:411 (+) Transcript_20054:545-1777(+)|eukprot:CAMPEP_0178996342 /NCGR_PEP_ID=MMETSP0795-20121207/8319_1 /TAXON_ID=88552 /ORGANISM="Amoebophrya sp., Strain Ameob2" /LENGTH=410 /DNA_ID=CAMNT_0020688729 /DNA_START=482 /DNA_END=1714 /DNA_ORIENTATION=-
MVHAGGGGEKWKGRKVVNEDELAEKQQKKEEERYLRRVAAEAEAKRKQRAQKAKQKAARAAEKEFKQRVQRLGVFRALIGGVASMQLKLSFSKWVEYVEILKDERAERYRRQRWQLNCPESARMRPNQLGLMHSTIEQRLRYHVEGDEACGVDLQLKSTALPQLLPRVYRDPSLPTKQQALADQLPMHPGSAAAQQQLLQQQEQLMRGSHTSSFGGHGGGLGTRGDDNKTDSMNKTGTDSMTLTHSSGFTHQSTDKQSSILPESLKSARSARSGRSDADGAGGEKGKKGGSPSVGKESSDLSNLIDVAGENRSMHTTGSSAFQTVHGGSIEKKPDPAPLHQQYGYDPTIMKFKGKGLHYRTGRPVFYDEKYSLFKFVYPHVNKRFFDYQDRIRSDALEYSYEPRGHVMVK